MRRPASIAAADYATGPPAATWSDGRLPPPPAPPPPSRPPLLAPARHSPAPAVCMDFHRATSPVPLTTDAAPHRRSCARRDTPPVRRHAPPSQRATSHVPRTRPRVRRATPRVPPNRSRACPPRSLAPATSARRCRATSSVRLSHGRAPRAAPRVPRKSCRSHHAIPRARWATCLVRTKPLGDRRAIAPVPLTSVPSAAPGRRRAVPRRSSRR